MKALVLSLTVVLASASVLSAFKIAGKGENRPIVQSAFGGGYYIRTIPTEDYGDKGETGVYRVDREKDELLDRYPMYMRGKLFLGWNPLEGGWSIVHLQPERIVSDNDMKKVGNVDKLAFYMKGKELKVYDREALAGLGLVKHQRRLSGAGSFTVQGIEQVPRTNHYVFKITRSGETLEPEVLSFDIATGELVTPEPGK